MGQIRLILLLSLLSFSGFLSAQTLDDSCLPPAQQGILVYDYADLLSSNEERSLQASLSTIKDSTSNVVAVVTHPDFCGYEPSVFAIEAGDKWGVGRGDKDNGVVIALKPRNGDSSGKLFIAVGSGLEGAIPDILTGRIVDKMIPFFKNGNWGSGLQVGINDIATLASGEISVDDYMMQSNNDAPSLPIIILMFFIFGVIPFLAIFLNTRREMKRNNLSFWLAFGLVLNDMQRKRASYNHFSHGRGGFGGGFGGSRGSGFGGFGGGGFSGGGAGGSF